MKIDKRYLYFKRWFKEIEISIHQGQWSDENIAHAAFYEGIKRSKKQFFEFANWFKEDENFRRVIFNDEIRYLDLQNYDGWTTEPQLELYFTLEQVYQYWLRIIKK